MNKKYDNFYNLCTKDVTFNGIVISEKTDKEYSYVYTVKGTCGIYKNKKFLISINKKEEYSIKYGDLINVIGEFKRPNSARNYKGFNYEEYLKTKKIYGNIKTKKIEILENDKANIIFTLSNDVKEKIKNNAKKILPKETAKLLIGLTLGDKNDLEQEIVEDFKGSNLSHMLAVSGAHVTYIVLGLTFVLEKIKIQKRKATIITIIFLLILMFITGFTPSVVRACLMGIIFLFSKIFYRKTDFITSISLSLLIILLQNPFGINNIGLQLSYLGTVGIVYFNKEINNFLLKTKIYKKIADLICITVSAQLLIMPVMILKFNTLSTTFLISNILAVLPFAVSIILGFITIIISFISLKIAKGLSLILYFCLQILMFISKKISNISFSNLLLTTPNVITVITYYIIVICIKYIYSIIKKENPKRRFEKNILKFIKTKILKKILISILIIVIIIEIFPRIKKVISKELDVYFIDVGQGDSTLVCTPQNKTILIDGGEGKNEILLPYLLDRKVKTIDFLIISHFDSDHCNGLIPILEGLKVNNLYISKQAEETEEYINIMNIAKRENIKINLVKSGNRVNIEKDIYIEILYPKEKLEYKDLNNNSIVSKLKYNNFTILFTGDIEESETNIIEMYKNTETLKADIIKISHHGSKTSSSKKFLEAVKPKIALIGVGENNRFGHPSQEILNKLKKYKIKTYRTDICGEISIKVNKKGKIITIKNVYFTN